MVVGCAFPYGQFRIFFLKGVKEGERAGWASGFAYSPMLRRMLSLARMRKDLATPGQEVAVLWGGFSARRCKRKVAGMQFARKIGGTPPHTSPIGFSAPTL